LNFFKIFNNKFKKKLKFLFYFIFSKFEFFLNLNWKSLIVAYKYENRYIKYDLTPILRQNRNSLMWNKDSEKIRSNSGTKFVPFKLYLVHRRSLEKISSYFDTFPVYEEDNPGWKSISRVMHKLTDKFQMLMLPFFCIK